MWKVQFLDRQHLLIKFGSAEGGLLRQNDRHTIFVVYNIVTTDIVAVYEKSVDELYNLFEKFYDHFRAPSSSLSGNFISSHSNNVHALKIFRRIKNDVSGFSKLFKKRTDILPITCQSQSIPIL